MTQGVLLEAFPEFVELLLEFSELFLDARNPVLDRRPVLGCRGGLGLLGLYRNLTRQKMGEARLFLSGPPREFLD